MGGLWEYRIEDRDDCDSAFGTLVGDVQGLHAVIVGGCGVFSSILARLSSIENVGADDGCEEL